MAAVATNAAKKAGQAAQAATAMATEMATEMATDMLPGTQETDSGTLTRPLADEEIGMSPETMSVENISPKMEATKQVEMGLETEANNLEPSGLSTVSTADLDGIEFGLQAQYYDTTRTVVWFLMSVSMFIAGLVMAIYGTIKIFDNSVVSAMLNRLDINSVGVMLKTLFVCALAFIGILDILVVSNAVLFGYFGNFKIVSWDGIGRNSGA